MKNYEEYEYNHMAFMGEIKLKVLKALRHLEDNTSCSKDEAIESLKFAIHYLVQEEIKEK